MKQSIIIIIIIIGVIVTGVAVLWHDTNMRSIEPFEGEPEDNIKILRLTPEINEFYIMYEKYGIEVADMTESTVRFAFMSSDGDNRHVSLSVRYYDGEPKKFTHVCSEIEPRSRIFVEYTIATNCFNQ